MKKLIIASLLCLVALSACSTSVSNSEKVTTPTSKVEISPTVIVPTITATQTPTVITPTKTATPSPTPEPVQINADTFPQLTQISKSILDQSGYVTYVEFEEKTYFENKENIPDGNFNKGYFESYRFLETGDIVGFLLQYPLECGLSYGKRSCRYDRYYFSLVNLTKNEKLWTQFMPVNMAGKELNELVDQLEIKDFKPRPIFSNRGYMVNTWSSDNSQIVIPIQVVNSTVMRDVSTGNNQLVLPWLGNAIWIGAPSPDGSKFAYVSGGPKGGMDKLIIMDTNTQAILFQYEISTSATDITWSEDNKKVAVGKNNGSLDLFDLETKKGKHLIERRLDVSEDYRGESRRGITRLKFSHDGKKIAFTESNYSKSKENLSQIVVFNLVTFEADRSYSADFDQSGEIIWSLDDAFAVTVTDFTDGRIILLNEEKVIEIPLTSPENISEYRPKLFLSTLTFNKDQTQLTVVRSVFQEVEVAVFEVKR